MDYLVARTSLLLKLLPNLDDIEDAAKLKAPGFIDLNVDILSCSEDRAGKCSHCSQSLL